MIYRAQERFLQRAYEAGRTASDRGEVYEANPFTGDQPDSKLAWSRGFNEARAASLLPETSA